jgi:lysophospholipase L1-like esterase
VIIALRPIAVLILAFLAITAPAFAADPKPTLFIIGDSMVKNGTRGQVGWGDPIAGHFDLERINVQNRAIGGRSSRTFQTEGRWDKVLAEAKAGDFVLIQFGHNDGGPLDDPARARGTLRGTGDESREIDNPITKKKETVHTYGWYLRKYVTDARVKGVTPIILSPVPRLPQNPVEAPAAEPAGYVAWSAEVARAEGVAFIDLHRLVLARYATVSRERIKEKYFTPADNTHTSAEGAALNADCVVEGLRLLKDVPLTRYLLGKPQTGAVHRLNFDAGATPSRPVSVAVPEGNYDVTVTLGHPDHDSATSVFAESRRLMLEDVHVGAGKTERRTFTVNIRNHRIASGGEVKLKERERDYLHWDQQLTLQFAGGAPAVRAVEIAPASDALTVYLIGDSTVTDQPREPYNSWGQMLPRFFKPGVAVANHAESGESLRSSFGARRIDKVISAIKAGDYLFIQFGHNDQKDKTPGAGAFMTYSEFLARVIEEAKKRQAIPVLLTPVSRRSFGDNGRIVSNLGDFPDAVRRLAAERDVPLIDLNAMSRTFYEAMGPEESKRAFAPDDNTHHNNYGSYQVARCVVEGIKACKLDLGRHLADDVGPFDPSRPDAANQLGVLPTAPGLAPEPDGD